MITHSTTLSYICTLCCAVHNSVHYVIDRSTHCSFIFFFFNDTATTEIYTLSLHDALPISGHGTHGHRRERDRARQEGPGDRKSTRLNSSHTVISYAVFCLKKKKKKKTLTNKNKIIKNTD